MINQIDGISLSNEISTGISIVDFYANWCQPCKALAPILEELSDEMPNIKFYKLNTDEQPMTTEEQGVRSIPALILYRNSYKIDIKIAAGLTKTQLKEWIEEKLK